MSTPGGVLQSAGPPRGCGLRENDQAASRHSHGDGADRARRERHHLGLVELGLECLDGGTAQREDERRSLEVGVERPRLARDGLADVERPPVEALAEVAADAAGAVCGPGFSVCHAAAIAGRSRPKALPSPTESAAKSSARRFESRASTWVIARTSAGATTGAVIRHWLGLFEARSGSSLVVLPSRSSVNRVTVPGLSERIPRSRKAS